MIDIALASDSVISHRLQALPLTAEAFEPFGAMIESPTKAGQKSDYTRWLGSNHTGMSTRMHANHVPMSVLPLVLNRLERHPRSAQFFLPLDVQNYVIIVAPSIETGDPDLEHSRAFLAPGNIGIVYRPGVWHASATVLDRPGSFCVLMSRDDSPEDDEFFELNTSFQVQR